MFLTNQQFDKIMRDYDARQINNRYLLDSRTQEVYSALPGIAQIDSRIASEASSIGIKALQGDTAGLSDLKSVIEGLTEERRQLLKAGGFPDDYLDPVYTCPKCRDTGFIGKEHCSCFREAATRLFFEESNMTDVISRENFDTFRLDRFSDREEDRDPLVKRTPYENMKKVLQDMKQYVQDFDTQKGSLFIFGTTGTGKTFLTNCLAKAILETGHSVLYFTTFSLFEMLSKYNFRYEEYAQESNPQHDNLMSCDLLIIDDLGAELSNNFTIAQTYSIINERILQKRPTIISSNLSLDDFSARYGQRIFSRICAEYSFIKLFGRDLRRP